VLNELTQVDLSDRVMRLFSVSTVAIASYCVFVCAIGDAALAQTTGTVSPTAAPAASSPSEEPPPGGCMPIGLTASGEIVFPFQCKDFIERHKAAQSNSTVKPTAAEEKPAATEEKPATDEPSVVERKVPPDAKAAPTQAPESAAAKIDQPEFNLVVKTPSSRRVELDTRKQAASPPGCTRFRSYDSASQTYRTYDGQLRQCR
jgi:BA14K-like protein